MEYTREFFVEVRVYRDTTKTTDDRRERFDSYEDALAWLQGQGED